MLDSSDDTYRDISDGDNEEVKNDHQSTSDNTEEVDINSNNSDEENKNLE